MSVSQSGEFVIARSSADPLRIRRLGFGAMRITGPGIWGDPPDKGRAITVLRRAVELGITFIDTADSYGPFVSEDLIREALHPYEGLIVATKGGLTRQGPDEWASVGRPEYLRQCVQMSLRRLGVERIDLWQLHRIDEAVPREDQFGVIKEMQSEGLIRHIGLSEVSVADVKQATEYFSVVTVQNLYNVGNRQSEALLTYSSENDMGFIPWFPLGNRELLASDGPLAAIAKREGCTPSQVAIAWLLQHSPVMLPIPGTGDLAHLEENSEVVELSEESMRELDSLA
ncbi:MAG: aldo/keto reductase [Candidatus Nanopelagicales bacterium]